MARLRPTHGPFWAKRDEERVERLVSQLSSTLGPTGWSLDEQYEFTSRALLSLVEVPTWVRGAWSVVGGAVQALAKGSDRSLTAFHRELEAQIEARRVEYESKGGACWFILPMRLPSEAELSTPRVVRVFGRDFGMMAVESVTDYLGATREGADGQTQLILQKLLPGTLVCVAGEGFPTESVIERLVPAFEALRGAMELILHYRESRYGWGQIEPWGSIPYPLDVLYLREGRPVDGFSFAGVAEWEPKKRARVVRGFMERLGDVTQVVRERPAEGSTEELIGDLLRLYAEAMEQTDLAHQLLSFWQLGEALTLKREEKGAGEKVVARLSWFGRELDIKPDDAVNLTLSAIMHKRNEAVHRGLRSGVDYTDVNLLKQVCEIGLNWLMTNKGSLPTRAHLAQWWAHFAVNDQALQTLTETAAFIGRDRRGGV